MLIGLALNQYFNSGLGNFFGLNTLADTFIAFFKGPSLEYKNFGKQNATLLKIIINKNTDKLTSDCF